MNFQALASCHLLIGSSGLAVDRLRPEGDEDCDLFISSGSGDKERLVRVQVKFRSQGLTSVELADALVKAWASGSSTPREDREIAVCVNILSSDAPLVSGWGSSIADTIEALGAEDEQIGQRLQRAVEAALGPMPDRPTLSEILSRSHVVQVSSSFGDLATAIATTFPFATEFHAQLATARLLDRLLRTAADNREAAGPADGHVLDRHAVASIMADTAAATASWVREIPSRRLVSVPSFDREPRESKMAFLRGVRARPEHVGAGYAAPRPRWLEDLQDIVDRGSSALLVGPSGSGKSTLMWQTAASRQQMKVFALNQVLETDVTELASFFRLMAPAESAPLLVCADDVDRPVLGGWSALLRELGADAQIRFIGTCREENFDPSLTASGVAAPLRPHLEAGEAIGLARALFDESVRTDGDLTTLYQECGGLLMEFVHAATTSRHLFDVLDEQAVLLLRQSAPTQALARVVLAADVCNIGVHVAQLRRLGWADHELSDALRRLNAEHVLMNEGSGSVRGLHPLRSQHLLNELHRFLPRLSETLAILVQIVDPRELRILMEAWVRMAPADVEALEEALARRISADASIDASTAAELLYRCEASVFAHTLHGWLSSADAKFFDALLLGGMGSQAEGMSLLTVGVWEGPLGGQRMQESLPLIKRYSELHEGAPLPRPVRRHVVSRLAPEGRARLADGLSRSLVALRYFVRSEAFEEAELADLIRRSVQTWSGDAPVAGFGYDGHLARALVEVTNQRMMVRVVAAIARSSSSGSDAAAQVLGIARDRLTWALQRGPAGLIGLEPEVEGVYSPEVTLLSPVDLLDGARTGIQDLLGDAIAIAGLESIHAKVLRADGEPFELTVFEHLSALAPARLETGVLGVVLQQDSTLKVGGSWFDWLGQFDDAMAVAATATEMTVSYCVEALHRAPNSSALSRLHAELRSALAALEAPIASPARPSTEFRSTTRDLGSAVDDVYTPDLLHKGVLQMVGLCGLLVGRLLGQDRDEIPELTDAIAVSAARTIWAIELRLQSFPGAHAQVELKRLQAAYWSLSALASCWYGPGAQSRSALRHVSASRSDPERACQLVLSTLERHHEASSGKATETLREELGAFVEEGWRLIETGPVGGLHRLPLPVWVLVSPPSNTLSPQGIIRAVERVPNLDGRVFLYPRDLRGQWADAPYYFEKVGVWRKAGPLQSMVVRDRLVERGVEHDVPLPKGQVPAELDALLPTMSLLRAVERLTRRPEPILASCVRDVRELITSAGDSLEPQYLQLAWEVMREVEGDETARSLALDVHHHLSTRQAGPMLLAWLEAQASSAVLAE